jgi:putative hydrolase of the HAD superfamily
VSDKFFFFDLDNTLYDYNNAHRPAQDALVEFLSSQLRIKHQKISIGLKAARVSVKERLGKTASSHSRLLYISEYLRTLECNSQIELALSGESIYWNSYLSEMKLFDHAQDFLLFTRSSGYMNVLVTDLTTSIQMRKLRYLDLDAVFDLVVTSEEAGGDKSTGKPEHYLRDLIGEVEGFSLGDTDCDHIFPNSTVFYKKVARKSNKANEFSSFLSLRKKLFPNPN